MRSGKEEKNRDVLGQITVCQKLLAGGGEPVARSS